jgi:capsular polysaccharide biosynthesis protein
MNPTLARYRELLVARWRWVVWGILFAMLIATAVMTVTPPVYRSGATVYVRTPGDISLVQDGGDSYARAHADTYAALATGTGVLGRVVADLGLDLTPEDYSRRVNADRRPDTALIDLFVKGRSAAEAQRGVAVVITELQATVRTLEAVPGSVVPRAELVMVDPPSPAKRILVWGLPVAPVLFGVALLGAVLGSLAAVLRTILSGQQGVNQTGGSPEVGAVPNSP